MGDRCTEQGAILAFCAPFVGCLGLAQGQFLGNADKTVQLRVELLDAGQQGTGQLFGGELLVGEAAGDLGEGQLMQHVSVSFLITR
ncbi:hypothetical protein D9M71_399230 [compost metagenome]